MKVVYVVVISLLLASCGPAPEQLTATAVMAQAQTQTAAPTATPTFTPPPTNTSTATATLTPTSTPATTPSPAFRTGDVIPHDVPGKMPLGMPDAADSEFLRTTGGGFVLNFGDTIEAAYNLILQKRANFPAGAVLVIDFENPLDPSTAIVQVVKETSENPIYVISKPLPGFKCKNYWVEVHIYSDNSMTDELGVHVQWINSSFC